MTINAFDFRYQPTKYTDPNGNKFRFCAQIFGPGAGSITCDVFLTAIHRLQLWQRPEGTGQPAARCRLRTLL